MLDLSIITRCRDHAIFLPDALDSIARQSMPVREVLVIDDGSTDDTSVVAQRFEDRLPIRIIRHSEPKGAVASLNEGVAETSSELVLPLDADDRLSASYVEGTVEALAGDPGLSLAYGAVKEFGASHRLHPLRPFALDDLLVENFVPVSAAIRRSALDDVGHFDPRFEDLGFEDWDLFVRLAAAGHRGAAVEGCWLEYRRHGASSRNFRGRHRAVRARAVIWWRCRARVRPRHAAAWVALGADRRRERFLR